MRCRYCCRPFRRRSQQQQGDEKNETLLLVPLPTWGDEKDTAARDVPSADNELLAAVRPSRVLLVVRRKGWAAVGSMLLPLPMLLMMLRLCGILA